MLKITIIAIVAYFVGVFGWAQIIGSLQNISVRKSLIYTLILWLIKMGAVAYVAIAVFDCLWPLVIPYVISFLQVIRAGRIQ